MPDRPPTKAMLHVLRRMADGWKFRKFEGLHSRYVIWGDKIDDMARVNAKTAFGLHERGLIQWSQGFPTSSATLTAKGREIADG